MVTYLKNRKTEVDKKERTEEEEIEIDMTNIFVGNKITERRKEQNTQNTSFLLEEEEREEEDINFDEFSSNSTASSFLNPSKNQKKYVLNQNHKKTFFERQKQQLEQLTQPTESQDNDTRSSLVINDGKFY